MPEKLMRPPMQEMSGVDGARIFNGVNVCQISPQHADTLVDAEPESLQRELAVANCCGFGRNAFKSLAETFGVSPMEMALRLKE